VKTNHVLRLIWSLTSCTVICAVVLPAAGDTFGAEPTTVPWKMLEHRESGGNLLPAYRSAMRRPLEYFGISIWSGPEEGGGYMGALAQPSTIHAGGVNVFTDSEVLETEEDYESLVEMAEEIIDFWAENGLEHERCGEMIERIGLVNFLEGIGVDVDPNMVNNPRQSSYVRMDGWDEEAEKWFARKAEA